MNVPYICSTCRRVIFARIRGRHLSQWQSRAFSAPSGNVGTTREENQNHELLDIADVDEEAHLKIPSSIAQRPWLPKKDAGDILEAIFESALKNDQPLTRSTPNHHTPGTDIYRQIDAVQKMLNDKVHRAKIWNFFVKHIAEKIKGSQQTSRPVAVSLMARTLFNDIQIDIKTGWEDSVREKESLPTMTEVVTTHVELGLMSHKDWPVVIWKLLSEIARRQIHGGLGELEKLKTSEEVILADLLGVLKIFSLQYQKYHDRPISPRVSLNDWSCLPKSIYRVAFQKDIGNRALNTVSKTLFPAFPPQGQTKSIACAAILTYGLLRHPSKRDSPIVKIGTSFLEAIGSVIGKGWINAEVRDEISQSLGITNLPDRDALWTSLLETVHQEDALQNAKHQPGHFKSAPDIPFNTYKTSLNYAMKTKEPKRIDGIFTAMIQHDEPKKGLRFKASKSDLRLDMYNHIIRAYMSCRDAARAIEVWNHMVQIGLTPTIVTWTAMLDGCRISRDSNSLETVWKKLLDSGTELDLVCWTTVICGFIESHGIRGDARNLNLEKGISLLEALGRNWLEAEKAVTDSKAKLNTAIKPTVHTLNAVMQSLFVRQEWDMAYRLIPWGRLFGIELDIITYNTLLRTCVRSNQTEKIQGILVEIGKSGLKADQVTHTILLEENLRYSSSFTHEERMAVVDDIFNEMHKGNVRPNMFIYGKLIYLLLRDARETGDIMTVQKVMDRMANQNLEPNEYILTDLVDYYFTRNPPDLAAIDQLILKMREKIRPDEKVFWDRVIEGYSGVGDTAVALKYFGKYDRDGARVGWGALCSLLHALIETGQVELAEQFVRDVRSTRQPPPGPEDKGYEGEHKFWEMATQL